MFAGYEGGETGGLSVIVQSTPGAHYFGPRAEVGQTAARGCHDPCWLSPDGL
jgi:hypothetical protein